MTYGIRYNTKFRLFGHLFECRGYGVYSANGESLVITPATLNKLFNYSEKTGEILTWDELKELIRMGGGDGK